MDGYIRKEDVIAWFMPYAHIGESIDADVVISDIKGMKAADVVPVVHGRWINAYPDIEPNPLFMYGICSNCGFEQGLSDKLNYCPNCGTKMDEGKV